MFNRYIREHSLNIKIYMQASVKLASSNAKLYTRNRSKPKYTCRVVFEERGMIRIYIYCMMHEYSIQPYRIFTDMAYLGFYHHTCKCLTDI